MDYIEVKAKTVNDAITEATIQLGVTSDQLDYEVIDPGKQGIFGLGSKPAVIKARKKENLEKASAEVKSESLSVAKPVKEVSQPKPEAVEPVKKEFSKKESAEIEGVEKEIAPKEAPEKPAEPLDADFVKQTAEAFLKDVFHAMELEVEIVFNFDSSTNTLEVEFKGKDMGVLIGKRGQTLDSLQYLTNLAVNKKTDAYVKVKLDTENYRKRRKETLENLAKNIAYKVKRSKRPVSLEPMNPYERRVIHSVLQSDRYVTTHSEGEEPFRHVVVSLKHYDRYDRDRNRNSRYRNKRERQEPQG